MDAENYKLVRRLIGYRRATVKRVIPIYLQHPILKKGLYND